MRVGSNFLVWRFAADGSGWNSGVIASYHLGRETIQGILAQMVKNGQKFIRLPLCFVADNDTVDGVNLNLYPGAHFSWQQEQNIPALLADIKAAGFEEVEIALMPQGRCSFGTWKAWDEQMYQRIWNMVAVQLVPWLKACGLPWWLDLNNELCHQVLATNTIRRAYFQHLWGNYTYDAKFPNGFFSIAQLHRRIVG